MSSAWRDRRFVRLKKSADRQYPDDLRKQNAASMFIAAQKKAIEREEHPASEDPFERLASGLRKDYPEIWNDVGQAVVEELRRGQP
jgi:hypothetical protein